MVASLSFVCECGLSYFRVSSKFELELNILILSMSTLGYFVAL